MAVDTLRRQCQLRLLLPPPPPLLLVQWWLPVPVVLATRPMREAARPGARLIELMCAGATAGTIAYPDVAKSEGWVSNWDGREAPAEASESLKKRLRRAPTRHLLLVRHGQYDLKSTSDPPLTELGALVAAACSPHGVVLADAPLPFRCAFGRGPPAAIREAACRAHRHCRWHRPQAGADHWAVPGKVGRDRVQGLAARHGQRHQDEGRAY